MPKMQHADANPHSRATPGQRFDWGRNAQKRSLEEQIERGFALLRFRGPLELDFCRYLGQSGRFSRACLLAVAFVAVLIPPLVDTQWLGLPASLVASSHWVQLGFMLPLVLVCALVCGLRTSPHTVEAAMVLLFLGIMTGLLVQRAVDSHYGFDFPAEFAGATVVAMFALARIRFWVMLAATLAACVAMTVNEWFFVTMRANDHYHLFAMALLVVLGVLGGYSVEYMLRRMWLNGELLGYLSRLDSLTGLLNRHALDEALARSRAHARRERVAYAVAMIDIDAFGAFNDHYGHQSGDVALRRVAAVLNAFARRPQDVCGRYGGEEFAVLWTDGAYEEFCDLAVAARDSIHRLHIEHAVSSVADWVTVSIGLCYVSASTGSVPLDDVLGVADRLLYEAKDAGRNRVLCENFKTDDQALAPAHGRAGLRPA